MSSQHVASQWCQGQCLMRAAGLFPEKILFKSFARCSFTMEMPWRSDKTARIAQLNPQLQRLPFFCTKNAINSYGPGEFDTPLQRRIKLLRFRRTFPNSPSKMKKFPLFPIAAAQAWVFFFFQPCSPKMSRCCVPVLMSYDSTYVTPICQTHCAAVTRAI